MKKSFAVLMGLILVMGLVGSTRAQQIINAEEAAKFIGQEKTVCGPVNTTDYLINIEGNPTFLHLDGPTEPEIFDAIIYEANKTKFEKPPDDLFVGKEICVTGTISTPLDSPAIVVTEPSQIRIK